MPSLSYLIKIFCCCCILLEFPASAAIFPREGAVLNYRIIGFSFPHTKSAVSYFVEIADGQITDTNNFRVCVSSKQTTHNRAVAEVPSFGATYTWRVVYVDGAGRNNGELHHFSTGSAAYTDTTKVRMRVSSGYSGKDKFYVIPDGSNVMYDNGGRPVWFMPALNGERTMACNIKYTKQHSLSCIDGMRAVELNYDGKVLWKTLGTSPLDTLETQRPVVIHHEFTKLANGHYMALTNYTPVRTGPQSDISKSDGNDRHHFFQKVVDGRLTEFDHAGNIVWSWSSADYFSHSDLRIFYDEISKQPEGGMVSHENAFYFDQVNKVIYLSYAEINRIIKIGYPHGNVLAVYGRTFDNSRKAGRMQRGQRGPFVNFLRDGTFRNGLFCGQHSCKLTSDGKLMLYNNNMSDSTIPQVLLMNETMEGGKSKLSTYWSFQCPVDDLQRAPMNAGGGNVVERADGSLFVSMSFPYSRSFIVNRLKQVLWSAILEKKNEDGEWVPLQSYRSFILSQQEFEDFIWANRGDVPDAGKHVYSSR